MWVINKFKEPAPPPASPKYKTPWRYLDWRDERENLLTTIKNFQPGKPEVNTLRILLHGPVGAGKSSFFKSVDSALQERISTRAQNKMYKVKKDGPGSYFPFIFNDTAGIQNEVGIHAKDIIKLLNGHINRGYTFNPLSSITDDHPKYNKNPTLKDKIHCLVAVLPADNVSMINDKVFDQMKEVRENARDLDIPEVIIMTKVDEACPLVKADLKNIYTSKKIKQKMEECSIKLGVTVDCIYPVKNYHEERDTDATVDILILDALKNIVNFANDHVVDKLDSE